MIERVPSNHWLSRSERIASSLAIPPAFLTRCASPSVEAEVAKEIDTRVHAGENRQVEFRLGGEHVVSVLFDGATVVLDQVVDRSH